MKSSFLQYRSNEYKEYDFWLFRKGNFVELFTKETPNTEKISFTFWEINNSTWDYLEENCLETVKISAHETISTYNYEKMKLFYLQYLFRSWSFEEEMRFDEEGKLTENSFKKLLNLHPVILRELTTGLFDYVLSEEDSITIAKQAHLLFAKNQSVSNPHRMISLYCNLSEMWNKFGLNYFDLKRLPLYERNALKRILSQENQIRSAEIKAMEAKSKTPAPRGGRR